MIGSGADEITLTEDVILEEGEEEKYLKGIQINDDNLIIDGNNHVIDAKYKRLHFKNFAKNLTFKNIVFKNSRSMFPISNNGFDLYLENCSFIGNEGAIYNCQGNIWVKNCCFYKHYLLRVSDGHAACIYNKKDSRAFVSHSHFYGNEVHKHYGLILNEGFFEIRNSHFHDNYAEDSDVCVIFNRRGKLTIDNSKFENNRNIFINDDFAQNSISIFNEDGEIFLSESCFENEHGHGESIYNIGVFHITDCKFEESGITNSFFRFGGMNRWISNPFPAYLEIVNSTFKDKGFIDNWAVCKIKSCNIDGIIDLEADGSLLINHDDFNLLKDKFILNEARFEESEHDIINKHNIYIIKQKDDLSLTNFIDLIEDDSCEIILNSDIFIPCYMDDINEGERIFPEEKYPIVIERDNIVVDGKGHTIDGNYQPILKITGTNVTLKNITFKNGFSKGSGAILNTGENLTLINCSFMNNIGNGCGTVHNKSSIQIRNCNFKDNISYRGGGVIYNEKESTIDLYDSKFEKDNSVFNDGLLCLNNSFFKIRHSGILNRGKLKLYHCNFENSFDGSIINRGEELDIEGSQFKYNLNVHPIPLIVNYFGKLNIHESSFEENSYEGKRRDSCQIKIFKGEATIGDSKFISNFYQNFFNTYRSAKLSVINCLIERRKIHGKSDFHIMNRYDE